MKKWILAVLLAASLGVAQAGTTDIVSQSCDVALTRCALVDTAGTAVSVAGSWVYSGAVSVTVGSEVPMACTAVVVPTSVTNYARSGDLTITCPDATQILGLWSATRSGSGRGGYQWHQHVHFEQIVRY